MHKIPFQTTFNYDSLFNFANFSSEKHPDFDESTELRNLIRLSAFYTGQKRNGFHALHVSTHFIFMLLIHLLLIYL